MKILFLNGPNLNLLGQREPEVYGRTTLADIEVRVRERAKQFSAEIDFRQSNLEGERVGWIQQTKGTFAHEEFRHKSLIAPVCCGQVTDFSKKSYILALEASVYVNEMEKIQ